jgi:hypothetical protein
MKLDAFLYAALFNQLSDPELIRILLRSLSVLESVPAIGQLNNELFGLQVDPSNHCHEVGGCLLIILADSLKERSATLLFFMPLAKLVHHCLEVELAQP